MFLPYLIHTSSNINQNLFYKVADDIYVKPMIEVRTTARIIAAQKTPDYISGSDYSCLDMMIATGRATTFLYHIEKLGRFKDAYIRYEKQDDVHMRYGELPYKTSLKDFDGVTHMHFITAHLSEIRIPNVPPVTYNKS